MRRLLLALLLLAAPAGAADRVAPVITDDGLHAQSWFLNSFLDLREDLAEAKAQGKKLAVFFEQRGCPYCRDLHEINLADPAVNDFVRANFAVLQLNLWGAREVTDFDGQALPEKELARKWAVRGSPTVVFFDAAPDGKSGRDTAAARLPGYLKPEPFLAMFRYVHQGRYRDMPFAQFVTTPAAQ